MTTLSARYVVERLEPRQLLSGQIFPGQRFPTPNMSPAFRAAEVNGDGLVDLVSVEPVINVMLGHGDGTFDAPLKSSVGSFTYAQRGDFDNDGDIDIVGGNFNVSGQILFSPGNGDGTFGPTLSSTVPGGRTRLTSGDFTGDGRLDLAVVRASASDFIVMIGNGDGTFSPGQVFATSAFDGLVAADFNQDGKLDLAASGSSATTVPVLLGLGDGTFAVPLLADMGFAFDTITAADLTGDGKPDLAAMTRPPQQTSFNLTVLVGNGDGTFAAPVNTPTGPKLGSLAIADLNRDGTNDLASAGFNRSDVRVMLATGGGAFSTVTSFSAVRDAGVPSVADFNRDGNIDVAVSSSSQDSVRALLGDGTGALRAPARTAVPAFPYSLATGDFNGDQRLDVASANSGASSVSILLTNSTGAFGAASNFPVASDPNSVAAADFDRNGKLDLATAQYSDNSGSILLNDGGGAFSLAGASLELGENPLSIRSADVNRDGNPDLLVANNLPGGNGAISLLLGNGDGTFAPRVSVPVGANPFFVLPIDLNHDSWIDLAVANYSGNSVSVLISDGAGAFESPLTFAVGANPFSLASADLNGDTHPDLVTANFGGNTISTLLGDGTGLFAPAGNVAIGNAPRSVVAADFDGDGKIDLAANTRFYSPFDLTDYFVTVVLGNGDGTFDPSTRTDYADATETMYLAHGDFNADGKMDLAIANFASAGVIQLLNQSVEIGTWTGAGDNATWSDPANWSSQIVPSAFDDVRIQPGTPITIDLNANHTHVRSLTLGNTTGPASTLRLPISGSRTLVTRRLTINGHATLDVNDNALIVDYSPDDLSPGASIQALINTARSGGDWTGAGIGSSAARTANPRNRTLGVLKASEFKSIYGDDAPFAGVRIDAHAVLVKYTYYGDADFNGVVNFDDYARIDNGFANTRTGWSNGDFDGNGVVDFDDYSLIDLAFNTQAGSRGGVKVSDANRRGAR